MRFPGAAVALLSVASLAVAAPAHGSGQLPDGLPNPSPSQLARIEKIAQGTLPNTPPPPSISDEGITNLKLIAFNELFEVAYFNSLIQNITHNVRGYTFSDAKERDFVLRALRAVLAQEELHALSANGGLSHFGVQPIEPCEYHFPVQDFQSAIVLASTFTDVVLGTLQDAVEGFAIGRDFDLAHQIASVIGNEGEQQGWYRLLQQKIPSELPFPTTSDPNFAFTAIQSFTVPGSCPNIQEIPLKTFEPLAILTPPGPKTQNIRVSFGNIDNAGAHPLWLTYINQLNLPIVEPLKILSRRRHEIIAEALFPYDANELNGLTIAAVTNSDGPFPNASAVAQATLAAPGLIIVN